MEGGTKRIIPRFARTLAGLPRLFTIRERIPRREYVFLAIVPIVLLLCLWQVLTSGEPEERAISINILPSPAEVARAFPALWMGTWKSDPLAEATGDVPAGHWIQRPFIYQVGTSFRRIAISFLLGCAIALPLGFAMGAFERVRGFFHPLALAGGYLPIPALVPLTMSIFQTGERQKIVFLTIAFVVYLLPLVLQAIDKVDHVFLQTAYTLGATTRQALTHVLISLSWEDVYRAMRQSFGVGWSYILLVEGLIIDRGLGEVVFNAQKRGPRENMYLALVAIVLIAFATDKIWEWGGRRLFPYRRPS